MRDSRPTASITRAFATARARFGQAGPRLRQVVRRPSRSVITNAIALLALLVLTVGEVRGMVAFFTVLALAVLLRSEHVHARQGSEAGEAQPAKEPSP